MHRFHIANLSLILAAILLLAAAARLLPAPADYNRDRCQYYYHTSDLNYCRSLLLTDTP